MYFVKAKKLQFYNSSDYSPTDGIGSTLWKPKLNKHKIKCSIKCAIKRSIKDSIKCSSYVQIYVTVSPKNCLECLPRHSWSQLSFLHSGKISYKRIHVKTLSFKSRQGRFKHFPVLIVLFFLSFPLLRFLPCRSCLLFQHHRRIQRLHCYSFSLYHFPPTHSLLLGDFEG